jgi:hypothetical protein
VKSFWRWTGAIFFALAFVFLVPAGIGTSLPIDHHAVCSAKFNKPARFLFQEVEDDMNSVRWRHDIASAVLVSGAGWPTAVWRETDSHGNTITYRTTSYVYGQKLARTIDYIPGMPFAGTWTYTFSFAPSKTTGEKRSSSSPVRQSSTYGKTKIALEVKASLDRLLLAAYGPPGTTRVTITEDGKIYNPFFRFLSRYVFGYAQSMQTYLTDLATELQETVQVSCEVSS